MKQLLDDVIELQTRVAFQEDLLAKLNEVIAKQDTEIVSLKYQMMILAQRMQEIQLNAAPSAGDFVEERPPHY